MNRCTEAIVDIHGIKWYDPPICVDGGIFRAKNTYTNLTFPSGSFKHTTSSSGNENIITENNNVITSEDGNFISLEQSVPAIVYDPLPYSGHFYGIRKYSGLAPSLPYVVNIAGKTGSTNPIDIPTEILGIEYNKNETDIVSSDYTGFYIPSIASGIEFGKSIASKNDLLAIGSPKRSLVYSYKDIHNNIINETLSEAGSVFLYRRNARPNKQYDWPLENYKSSWNLETILTLPSGLLKDYSVEEEIDIGLPFKPIQTRWFVGQEGRQFGHSLDISIDKNKKSLGEDSQQILVVGGPSSKWKPRDLDYDQPSGVSMGLMIFTDEFQPYFPKPTEQRPYYVQTYAEILESIYQKDLLFNYFGSPRIKFDVKIAICQPIADNPDIARIPFDDKPEFITLNYISRNSGRGNNPLKTKKIFDDMWNSFIGTFPYDTSKIHNGIPPILGLYIDNSSSLGRESLEPAIDQFIDFYKYYSFSGGLVDSYGEKCSGVVVEYTSDDADAENWIEMSKSILYNVLDTGNIIANNYVRLLTNSVGIFNRKLAEFNIPPESGGRVYIFEKESGSWNLIQEIKSPNITYQHPDRFGHAVSISDDGDVIAIGSPYIQQAVTVYEKKSEQKEMYYANLINWVRNNHPDKYAIEIEKYDNFHDAKALYLSLDPYHKFKSRLDMGIEEYQNIYSFDYSNMQPIGAWTFITTEVAPTSRLGYSVDVNENGSIVVASSPTDSFNQYNDGDVYYAYNGIYKGKTYNVGYIDPSGQLTGPITSSWASSTNAGSIHVFESRKYYPHSKVIEYGKFGNLHENISNNTPDSGHFNYLSQIFRDKNFTKTRFDGESKIPIDVGLAFIITPAVDALSNEVFNNIVNWLALGDRNLVLVGNDPRWENNGIYENSNNILNKLLERLQSRMRIVSARNEHESLNTGYSTFNNIVPSFVPEGSTYTYVNRLPIRGSGVGDIKMYMPGYFEQMPCQKVTDCSPEPQKIQIQTKCEMPLIHYGDLRAQWNAMCCSQNGRTLIYGYNWPLAFGSYVPGCADAEFPSKPTKNFEPIPLLVAAESVKQETIYPAVPAQYQTVPIYETAFIGQTYYEFGDPQDDVLAFAWDSGNSLYNSLKFNITNNLNKNLFYVPTENGILQAKAIPTTDISPFVEKVLVSDKTHFAVEYPFGTTSKVIVLAGTNTESQRALYAGAGDQNIKFYINLVSSSKTVKGNSNIAQLGGWTGRESFRAASPDSILASLLLSGNDVTENVINLDGSYNVAWIASPDPDMPPSSEDINALKNWLSSGNKKLIITYNESFASAQYVKNICQQLGINMELIYLPYLDKYQFSNVASLEINDNHQIGGKFFLPRTNIIENFYTPLAFYPIKLTNNATSLANAQMPIYDDIPIFNQNWHINAGIVELNVPVIPGSGYKLFITTAVDSPSELLPIQINVDNVVLNPILPYPNYLYEFKIQELNDELEYVYDKSINTGLAQITIESAATVTTNFQVAENVNSINIYISSARVKAATDIAYTPKTVKLVGISGVPIPILQKVAITETPVFNGQVEEIKISDAVPESREIIDVIRTISTDNTKYCTNKCQSLGGQLIEDGPVVAAQELEILSSFDAGVARSRITVLTDSSMIQGRTMIDENQVIPNNIYAFIRSLYPETYFPYTNYGRQFDVYTKLISPERGSPSKYYSYAPFSGITQNFNGSGSITRPFNQNESKYLPQHVTRPKNPWEQEDTEEQIAQTKNFFISGFLSAQLSHYASTARFSGIVDGTMYSDATVRGGLPPLLKDKGYDHIDLDKLPSGYLGDLFGYSVCVRGKKILVGSPFSAFSSENITPWNNTNTKLHLGHNGGAGSVYMFEKSGDAGWNCIEKFRPQSLMGQLSGINEFSDQFGHSVSMQNDTIIIGAPNHRYNTYYENIFEEDAAFARKNFNPEFRIPERNIFDLGLSGNRILLDSDGINAHNAGAIYVYENKITDWENKIQSWTLVEKIVSNSTSPSGERFGRNIYLSRPYRSDSDYTIIAGCNFSSGIVFSKDVMLRNQSPSLSNPNAWISAKVFGSRDIYNSPTVHLSFSNSGNNLIHYASGTVVANSKGEIFLEVSGQDPSTKGFISHRPYIEYVYGHYQYGKLLDDGMILHISGGYIPPSSQMPLIIDVENKAYVYNTLGLYSSVKSGDISAYPSGLNLFVEVPSGTSINTLNLYTSGIGSQNDILNLRVRGK